MKVSTLLKKVLFLFIFFSSTIMLSGQAKKIGILPVKAPTIAQYRAGGGAATGLLNIKTTYEQDYNAIQSAQSSIVQTFLADSRFEVVDRTNIKFVEQELDRQKAESFMDGYIVEQGKQLGTDFMCRSFYDIQDKVLTIKIFSVEDGTTIAEKVVKFKRNLLGSTSFDKDIKEQVRNIIKETWPITMVLVEVVDGNGKEIKKVLAASMAEVDLKEDEKLNMYISVEREVAGKKLIRDKVFGYAKVKLKENENFYILDIKEGKKEARKYFDEGLEVKFKIGTKK